MKNWFLPAALLGISGVGLVMASERGRQRLFAFLDRMATTGDPFGEFNKVLEDQMQSIQATLDNLSQALEGR